MSTALFYLGTILIWGSTWLAIQYQVNVVDSFWSVAYRFALATAILFIYCWLTRKPMKFSAKAHGAIFLQSILMFSLNYMLLYLGSVHLISGYVAIAGASIAIINIFNARLFLKTPFNSWVICGAVVGIAGVVAVFWDEVIAAINGVSDMRVLVISLAYCLVGTYLASLGNIVSKRNQQLNLPILQTNAWGMLYGTLCTTLIALCLHRPATFSWTFSYVSALMYLSLFGTVIAFGLYLKLIGNIGPERAAYIFVITPIVALVLSTFFEGFQWQSSTLIGIILILVGNILVMHKPAPAPLPTKETA